MTASMTNTTSVETRIASTYAHAGSGVPLNRLSTPDSRRMTTRIASPANAVADDAVAEQPGKQVLGARDAFALDRVVAVYRAEQDEDEQREDEREECELVASPVEPLLRPKLVEQQAHSSSPPVRSR